MLSTTNVAVATHRSVTTANSIVTSSPHNMQHASNKALTTVVAVTVPLTIVAIIV